MSDPPPVTLQPQRGGGGGGGEGAPSTRRAVLIGVRTYPNVPVDWGSSLGGCHNDVNAIRRALLDRGFEATQIDVLVDVVEGCGCPFCDGTVLSDGNPTRQGILTAVQRLAEASGRDDLALIYFSGHGSEILGHGLQTGRRFQTLVPHDSGRGESQNRDISDGEVQGWIRRLNAKTPYVTLIFDCCHSGGLSHSRGEATPEPHNRRLQADERREPEAYASDLWTDLEAAASAPSTVSTGWRGADGDAADGGSVIVLSASADHELSSETVVDGLKLGLFTHRLCQALAEHREEDRTWADLMPRVVVAVSGENLAQHPRRQGDGPIFERGPIKPQDVEPPDIVELHKLAVVIGIDYDTSEIPTEERPLDGFPPLRTPSRDAREVARVLEEVQGYEVVGLSSRSPGPLLNGKATRRRIHKLIERLVSVRARTRRDCAVLIYFAGHGITRPLEDGSQAGYLIPWGAERGKVSTWLPMKDLRDQLVDGIQDVERLAAIDLDKPLRRLTSRHLLLVLDCCFAGALSYDFFRGDGAPDRPVYYSEYRRFVEGRAWQLLSSSSADQRAMDRDPSDPDQAHSPFAQALIEGLSSSVADRPAFGRGDQIITAGELHQWIDGYLGKRSARLGGSVQQTPGLVALRPLEGQYIFYSPGARPRPLPDPPLDPSNNPWRGERPYDGAQGFYGRLQSTLDLLARFLGRQGHALAVHGPSGCGATSLVQAGLLPILANPLNGRRQGSASLRRYGRDHLQVPWEELAELRAWLRQQAVDLTAPPPEIGRQIRSLATQAGWLAADSAAAGFASFSSDHLRALGMPSFNHGTVTPPAWWTGRRLTTLLAQPEELARRLRLWHEEGGLVDFFSLPEASLERWLGRWQILSHWPASLPEDDATRLLVWRDGVTGLDTVTPPVGVAYDLSTFLDHPHRALVVTVQAPLAPPSGDPWYTDLSHLDLGVAASHGLDATRDTTDDVTGAWHLIDDTTGDVTDDVTGAWHLIAVPSPSRDELREMVQGPAADHLLAFEPSSLVDGLLDEAMSMSAPLPVLSGRLAEMVASAWHRRRDADRQLIAADLGAPSAVQWLAQRAEETYRQLIRQDAALRRGLRRLLRRCLAFDGPEVRCRAVRWEELRLADGVEATRLEGQILPALVAARVMVARAGHLELAHPGLLSAWSRMRRWTEVRGDSQRLQTELWQRAVAWRAADFAAGKLLTDEETAAATSDALGWHATHNLLERALVAHSQLQRQVDAVDAMTAEARRSRVSDWPRAVLLGAEAATLASANKPLAEQLAGELGNRHVARHHDGDDASTLRPWLWKALEESAAIAEQLLHDLLTATPLGLPLRLPAGHRRRVRGLAFGDDDRLQVRLQTAEGRVQAHAWKIGPVPLTPEVRDSLSQAADDIDLEDGPVDGLGEVVADRLPLGGPMVEFPMMPRGLRRGPKAQSGHDHGIRWFPESRLLLPAELRQFVAPPVTLFGHTACPTFLALSPDQHWLASAANLEDDVEIRLWPLSPDRPLPAQPLSLVGLTLEGWSEHPEAATWIGRTNPSADDKVPTLPRLRARRFTPTHASTESTLTSPDGLWQVSLSPRGDARLCRRGEKHPIWRDGGITTMAFNPNSNGPLLVVGRQPEGLSWICRDGKAHPMDDGLGRASSLAIRSDGYQLAIGRLDGGVHLRALVEGRLVGGAPMPTGPPLTLRSERDQGFAVRALAYDASGRRLAVERRAVYAPHHQRLDLYELDLATCILLACGHMGEDLPTSAPNDDAERSRQQLDYLQALGLSTCDEVR